MKAWIAKSSGGRIPALSRPSAPAQVAAAQPANAAIRCVCETGSGRRSTLRTKSEFPAAAPRAALADN